ALLLEPTPTERATAMIGAALLIGAVTPGVIFKQYWAGPAFAFFLLLALYLDRLWLSGRLAPAIAPRARLIAASIALVLGVGQAAKFTAQPLERQRAGVYGITAVARTQAVLKQTIAAIDRAHPYCHDELVTAFGPPAIGAGATFAPISSTGAFAMRLDDIFA